MTLKEVQTLSDEALRIKVAELCGWSHIRPIDEATCDVSRIGAGLEGLTPGARKQAEELATPKGHPACYNTFGYWLNLPDYPHDLNAMHEAEKAFDPDGKQTGLTPQWDMYLLWLNQTVSGYHTSNRHKMIHATARQRAEAFVLTLGG